MVWPWRRIIVLASSMFATTTTLALPPLNVAPAKCPLQKGNLVDVVLFARSEIECRQTCRLDPGCRFYHFYGEPAEGDENHHRQPRRRRQPSQCFLYDACDRQVLQATANCPLTRENTVRVEAFVGNADECETFCSRDERCRYYKYFNDDDEQQQMMCYHLKKCTPRKVIKRAECPLQRNNYVDHFLFIGSLDDCRQRCQDREECRYYYWYPIEYDPAPLYCYLYASCLGGADEERVGVVLAGRHPGHYFDMGTDVVFADAVCPINNTNQTSEGGHLLKLYRAGATAEYLASSANKTGNGMIVLCGGRSNRDGQVMGDCLAYKPKLKMWSVHSALNSPREEYASVVMQDENGTAGDANTTMYIMGGMMDGEPTRTVERYKDGVWVDGPSLPEARSRFCSVAVDESTFAILGGEVAESSTSSSSDFKLYHVDRTEWASRPSMLVKRKDHACTVVLLGETRGVLVSGGIGEDDQLLDSVEFFPLLSDGDDQVWMELSPLKLARTEHGMAVIAGLPTVMGGVSSNQFLSSVEVLDHSFNEQNPLGLEWRVTAHSMSCPRYDFALATVPISQVMEDNSKDNMDKCNTFIDGKLT